MICLLPYKLPKIHAEIFKKYVECLVILGVPGNVNDFEWVTPYSPQHKPKPN